MRLFLMCLCQDVGVAQLIQCVNALVCMVLLFHSLIHILCCTCVGGVGHLFLQLLTFTGHDYLLSGSLLGDLLCVWPLNSLLGSPFMH